MHAPPLPGTSHPNDDRRGQFLRDIHPHGPALGRWLRRRYPGLPDVDDIVQESFLRVWRRQCAQPVAHGRAFLFQVARHLAFDCLRRTRASPFRDAPWAVQVAEPDPGANVAESASRLQEVELLHEAIASLPHRCREIFILRKLHGLSPREIARQLCLSEQTVRGQAHRGLRRCGQLMTRLRRSR